MVMFRQRIESVWNDLKGDSQSQSAEWAGRFLIGMFSALGSTESATLKFRGYRQDQTTKAAASAKLQAICLVSRASG
jgi:hypothetical protein